MFFEVLFLMLIIFFLEVDQMISITIYPDNPCHLSNIHILVDIYPLTTSNCLRHNLQPHPPPQPLKKRKEERKKECTLNLLIKTSYRHADKRFQLFSV